ncbi:MAG: hypothetical protein K2M60_06090 [Lachnospiraceae bacterium]|nr:hypothetical protein [Lachnospiraceae bacterium]MDE6252687.1 hypothetical protein [Lachnospiraceae bacterium]
MQYNMGKGQDKKTASPAKKSQKSNQLPAANSKKSSANNKGKTHFRKPPLQRSETSGWRK